LFGLIAYSVQQRTPEFAIRLAIGANSSELRDMICTQAMKLAAAGVIVGLGASCGLTKLKVSFLYDVKPTDLSAFGTVTPAIDRNRTLRRLSASAKSYSYRASHCPAQSMRPMGPEWFEGAANISEAEASSTRHLRRRRYNRPRYGLTLLSARVSAECERRAALAARRPGSPARAEVPSP
jgi:hypothetical protein